MKYLTLILALTLTTLSIHGQDISGQWNGILNVQGTQLKLVFNITQTDNIYNSTMDSPDQGATGIPVTSIIYKNSILKLIISTAGIQYQGTLNQENIFIGTFKQSGQSFPLNLAKEKFKKQTNNRPQEPITPYPYIEEEVSFENKEAGVL